MNEPCSCSRCWTSDSWTLSSKQESYAPAKAQWMLQRMEQREYKRDREKGWKSYLQVQPLQTHSSWTSLHQACLGLGWATASHALRREAPEVLLLPVELLTTGVFWGWRNMYFFSFVYLLANPSGFSGYSWLKISRSQNKTERQEWLRWGRGAYRERKNTNPS